MIKDNRYTYYVLLLKTGEYVVAAWHDFCDHYAHIIKLNNTNYIGPCSEPWINHPILSTEQKMDVVIDDNDNLEIMRWLLYGEYVEAYETQAKRLFGDKCFDREDD